MFASVGSMGLGVVPFCAVVMCVALRRALRSAMLCIAALGACHAVLCAVLFRCAPLSVTPRPHPLASLSLYGTHTRTTEVVRHDTEQKCTKRHAMEERVHCPVINTETHAGGRD